MSLLIAVLIGFFLQGMLAVNHPRLGSLFGFVITTGVLLYGLLFVYEHGGVITLFVVQLSRPMFIGFCLVWYIWDLVQLMQTKK